MKSPSSSSSPVKTEAVKSDSENVRQTCPSFHLGHNQDRLERFRRLAAPHVESFDYMLSKGLEAGLKDVEPMEILIVNPQKTREADSALYSSLLDDAPLLKCWFEDIRVHKPTRKTDGRPLYPRESRERSLMYAGALRASFCYQIVERRHGVQVPGTVTKIPRDFGELPIMVMSKACHLHGSTSQDLVERREEVSWWNTILASAASSVCSSGRELKNHLEEKYKSFFSLIHFVSSTGHGVWGILYCQWN